MVDHRGSCLLCRVGGFLCALPLQHVEETMRPLPVEPISGVPSYVRGLALVRGRPIPVVDTASLLGDESSRSSLPTRFVTVKVESRRVALAVDGVIGIHTMAGAVFDTLPPLFQAGQAAIAAVGMLDAELLLVLQSARLVPDEAWHALRRAAELP